MYYVPSYTLSCSDITPDDRTCPATTLGPGACTCDPKNRLHLIQPSGTIRTSNQGKQYPWVDDEF
jgi:hypothetical protein